MTRIFASVLQCSAADETIQKASKPFALTDGCKTSGKNGTEVANASNDSSMHLQVVAGNRDAAFSCKQYNKTFVIFKNIDGIRANAKFSMTSFGSHVGNGMFDHIVNELNKIPGIKAKLIQAKRNALKTK